MEDFPGKSTGFLRRKDSPYFEYWFLEKVLASLEGKISPYFEYWFLEKVLASLEGKKLFPFPVRVRNYRFFLFSSNRQLICLFIYLCTILH